MTPEELCAKVQQVYSDLGLLVDALDKSPDMIGCLSLADYCLLNDLVRSYLLHRGT